MPGYWKKETFSTSPTDNVKSLDERYVSKPTSNDKWMYTLQTTLLFLLISNEQMYKLTQELLGSIIYPIAKNGCPTQFGLIVHAIVFTLLLRLMMNF